MTEREALDLVATQAIRDPTPHSSAWLVPAGVMDAVRAALKRPQRPSVPSPPQRPGHSPWPVRDGLHIDIERPEGS